MMMNIKELSILLEVNSSKRDELFLKLKEVVNSKRIKKCEPIIEWIEKYQLSSEDKELFARVKKSLKRYNFKEAINILNHS